MITAPIIFCTVVTGIAGMQDINKLGRVGIRTLFYFEVVSTLALIIGLAVVHIFQPGVGMNVNLETLDTNGLPSLSNVTVPHNTVEFILNIIPSSIVDAFAKNATLQVILFSLLFGVSLAHLKEQGNVVMTFIEQSAQVLFGMVTMIIKLAPLGTFGAMAFTVGKYGIASLIPLIKLMGCFYFTCLFFIFVVLGLIAHMVGFNVFNFIVYIKEELFIVLGTTSSESVLPRMLAKMERLGCPRSVVGLVLPTGYSFNMEGTSIYLSMAAIFVAQATNTHVSFTQELTLFGVLLLTSKGSAGIPGSSFITLAATLSSIPTIPVEGLALILGIDRFMSEARVVTNLIGNGVGSIVASKWENELNEQQLNQVLIHKNFDSDFQ
jgi:aerobic C4-dicarboxylate transport protein